MRFIVKVAPFAKAVASAAKVLKEKTGMPVLECVLLEAQSGAVAVGSTDIETSIAHNVPAGVTKDGRICIPGTTLAAYLANLPDGELEVISKKTGIELRYGTSKAEIFGLPADTFPTLPHGTTRRLRDIQGSKLAEAVMDTGFAAAKGNGEPASLHGALVNFGTTGLSLTATDGYRLARYQYGLQDATAKPFVVPVSGLEAIARAFKDSPAISISTKSINDNENHLVVEDGLSRVTCRLINAQYPSVEPIINTQPTLTVTVERDAFYSALRRAGLMTDTRARSLEIQIKNDLCEIAVRSETNGNGHEVIDVVQHGSSINISVNAQYFAEILKHIEAQTLRLGFAGPFGPIAISANPGPAAPEPGAQYLLMPLKQTAAAA